MSEQSTQDKPPPCLWLRDLEDTVSEQGRRAAAYVRETCQCEECTYLREQKQ